MNKVDLDYIAFSFMGVHTSELNIIRVSGGDRYEDSVTLPSQIRCLKCLDEMEATIGRVTLKTEPLPLTLPSIV